MQAHAALWRYFETYRYATLVLRKTAELRPARVQRLKVVFSRFIE